MVNFYDNKMHLIKRVYSHYAVHLVLKNRVVWIKNRTAIRLVFPISKVFTSSGMSLSIADAMSLLAAVFGGNAAKAAGSLGGASKAGFIELQNGFWTRVR